MTIKSGCKSCLFVLAGLLTTNYTLAAETNLTPEHAETRHGAINRKSDISVEGGFTAITQSATDSDIQTEATASFDLVTSIPTASGEWVIYVEGNITPKTDGVSSILGDVNADAGSALDRDGRGRLQVSEAHYFTPWQNGLLVSGLLDTTTSLDASEIANDETSQFLSAPLVHNPTIEFPDYTLGAVYNYETGKDNGFTVILTSSHGLADNPDASYAQLVDVGDDGKGLFAATEAQWKMSGLKLHAGLWVNSADHPYLDGSDKSDINFGTYLVIDGSISNTQWNLRWGMANDKVSKAASYIALAVEKPISFTTIGAGIAHTAVSSNGKGAIEENSIHSEVYVRLDLADDVHITPTIQWLQNSNFDSSEATFDKTQAIFSARLSYTF